MNEKAKIIAEQLGLLPHPEGGYFKEIYRSEGKIKKAALPERYSDDRNFCTSIFFMLSGNDKSHFHRIKSDEIWHYYSGTTLVLHLIDLAGNYSTVKIGNDILAGETPQAVISHGNWFAAEVEDKNSYALVGCTVSPGFDFADFELARQAYLSEKFPQHFDLIKRFTKE
ncbi:MAG: cupin domain-containing protein [Ignavibacteriales bacterium]|nr:cupin domain-containing protein [Ignavibacteriales bacterium]